MPGANTCPPGYQYYSCHGNDFKGCCSVNPCSLPECPPSFLPDRSQEDSAMSSNTEPPATTTPTPTPTSTKTDSGVTHTVPNNSVVTVTKHTVVFSEAPLSTESSTDITTTSEAPASTAPCSTCTLAPTTTNVPSTTGSGGGFPSGAVAGAATGGAVIIILVLILVFVSNHRKKHRVSCDASETETLGGDSRVNGCEKSSHSNAGYTRPNSDPFAPFGGRVDQSEEPPRPPSGTFEMDGAGISAVELPAICISEAPDTARTASCKEDFPVVTAATDPAATLASPTSPQGKITYVNQWNQYRAMAAGDDADR